MNKEQFQAIFKIRAIAHENITDPSSEQKMAISTLKNLTNMSYGIKEVKDDKITDKVSNIVKILAPNPKEDWEFEINKLWNNIVSKGFDIEEPKDKVCTTCQFLRDNPAFGKDINYCAKCGKKLHN